MFKEEDPQAGSLTGWKLMPHLLDKNCASRAVAGWIKGRMMGPLSGTFSLIRFRQSCTHHVSHCMAVYIALDEGSRHFMHIIGYIFLFCSCSL